MSFVIAIEALKFYKLKQERLVQVLFLFCFGLNAVSILYPIGDTDFSSLSAWMTRSMTLMQTGESHMILYPPALSGGNLLFLGTRMLVLIANLFVSYFYAAAYSAERDGMPAMKGVKNFTRSLPRLLLLLLLLIVPAFLSMFLLMIPFVLGALMFVFAPLLITEQRLKIGDALQQSYELTRGRKFYLFFSFVLISVFTSILENITRAISGNNQLTWVLLSSLVTAISALILGRLIGLCYVFFGKQLRYLSFQQFFNRNPQEAMRSLLGQEEDDGKHKSDRK